MSNQNKNTSEERFVVAVGDNRNVTVLDVPAYQLRASRQTGEIIAQSTVQLPDSWNCRDSVINMVFDTTASNMGQHVSAACVTLQQRLDRA